MNGKTLIVSYQVQVGSRKRQKKIEVVEDEVSNVMGDMLAVNDVMEDMLQKV